MKINKQDTRFSSLFTRLQWSDLDTAYLRQLIAIAREEDLDGAGLKRTPKMPGDATTSLLGMDKTGQAQLVTRREMVACGLPLVSLVLEAYGKEARFEPAVKDAETLQPGSVLGTVSGTVGTLLQAERVLLNFLQHLSGIATHTAAHVAALGWTQTRLLDTRKTTPGFRMLEKYAVACGGGWNHRLGLFDRVMLKDNHLVISEHAGETNLKPLVEHSRKRQPDLLVEIEVDRMDQISLALEAGADIILLDNFTSGELAEAVSLINGSAFTEASGGITLETLPELGTLGLDFVSCGALIHQSRWQDIGMDWQ